MSEHTKGPWSVWSSNSHIRISAIGDGDVVSATIAGDGKPVLAIKEADANRIVACVNACAGLNIKQLELAAKDIPTKQVINGYLDMKAKAHEMMEHRDELLAALKELLEFPSGQYSEGDAYEEFEEAWEKAEELIAKIEAASGE